MHKIRFPGIFIIALTGIIIFSSAKEKNPVNSDPRDSTRKGKPPEVITPDVVIASHGTKICQLVGEYDRQQKHFTQNRTFSRYRLRSTDLGVPFRYANRTYLLFGDTQGAVGRDRDAIAYTTDTTPDNGLALTFMHDAAGVYKPVTIPGIAQGAYDVPMAGVEVNGKMYIYATTGHTASIDMGESVIARSDDSGNTFHKLYTFSKTHFINVSIVKTNASKWKLFPDQIKGKVLVIFGTGAYRKSDVYLACQPAKEIENHEAIRYFAGIDGNGKPIWSREETLAVPLFNQPSVGELSVSYNHYIHR